MTRAVTPYREPPQPSPRRWWHRLACAFGRHEWSHAESRVGLEVIRPCQRCSAVRVWVPAVPQLGEWTERRP